MQEFLFKITIAHIKPMAQILLYKNAETNSTFCNLAITENPEEKVVLEKPQSWVVLQHTQQKYNAQASIHLKFMQVLYILICGLNHIKNMGAIPITVSRFN